MLHPDGKALHTMHSGDLAELTDVAAILGKLLHDTDDPRVGVAFARLALVIESNTRNVDGSELALAHAKIDAHLGVRPRPRWYD